MRLIISEMKALGRYVSREFYCIMRELMEEYGWAQIETDSLAHAARPLKDELRARLGRVPETILFWEGYDFLNARAAEVLGLDCRKCVFADDLHSWDAGMKERKRNAYLMCDTVLSTYAYVIENFFPGLARVKNVVWVPHSASPDFMLPFNERPENAALLSGAVSHHYKLRPRMWRLYEGGAYAIAYRPHPGYHCDYDHAADGRVGAGYARTINRYRTAFTDGPVYGYLVAKYFEIPAAGALLLGADEGVGGAFEKLGFIDGVNYVAVNEENLEERLAYVLAEDNHAALDEVRRAGQRLVWERHKTSDRARLIDEVCGS